MSDPKPEGRVVIIRAGPADLTCGYELARNGHPVVLLERDARYVGGLARTVEYQGFRFDIGGHRFFSKNREIEALWTELMGERMRVRRRLSRIQCRGGSPSIRGSRSTRCENPREAFSCLLSLGCACIWPPALRDLFSELQGKSLRHTMFAD
jgi:choline dehydrogenase-like flavoprotein